MSTVYEFDDKLRKSHHLTLKSPENAETYILGTNRFVVTFMRSFGIVLYKFQGKFLLSNMQY